MKYYKAKKFLFVFLLVASLMSGLTLHPVTMTTVDAKTRTSVTVKVGTKKVNKKTITLKVGNSRKIKLAVTPNRSGTSIPKTELWFQVKVIPPNDPDKKIGTPVVLEVNGQTFQAIFYDNPTADELLKKMPMTLDMKELNGNEKYHFFDTEFPTDEKSPGKISAGDIMLYGSDCLVTFYQSHSTPYHYTPVGKIENASGFAEAVGSGTVTITYSKHP